MDSKNLDKLRQIQSFLEMILELVEVKITIMGIFLGLTTANYAITSWCPTC